MNNLGLFLDAKAVADFFANNSFTLFGKIVIHYYAITMVLALVSCAIVGAFIFPKRGIKRDFIIDVMIAVIPCAIIGARLWYVLLDIKEFVIDGKFIFLKKIVVGNEVRWTGAFAIWEGGLAIHGGIAGGALGLYIISKIHKIKLSSLLDIGASLLPLGQAIGRWGNFFNQEVYGSPTSITTFPFSVYIEAKQGYFLALFFYEMVLNLLLLAILLIFFFKYKGKTPFYSTAFYLIGYGVIRACLEPLRSKEFQMGNFGIPSSVLTSIASIIIGVVILVWIVKKDIDNDNRWWKTFFKDFFKKEQPLMETALDNGETVNTEKNEEILGEQENAISENNDDKEIK